MPRPEGRHGRINMPVVLRDYRDRIRALEALPPLAQYEIKVFSDLAPVTTGDGKFYWAVPEDLREWYLVSAEAFVSTVSSSGGLLIQINNTDLPGDMLSTRISIDVSEKTSFTAATRPVVNTTNWQVDIGDMLRIDVDSAGTGAKGLGVIVRFNPAPR